MFRRTITPLIATALAVLSVSSAYAERSDPDEARPVDIVIALDVSGSMSGLIESTKQRLWDIVNEFEYASPQPELRLAIITFGNPEYGEASGYVRIDQRFTSDLDKVNETLFSFGTNGGDEYVARAVSTAVNSLQWSDDPDALRIMFVAGNEGAEQDPQITSLKASAMANRKDIVVNLLYAGGGNDPDAASWRDFASMGQGMFASIDQDRAAVANVATPMDDELQELNEALNETYIAFGKDGDEYHERQKEQDKNTRALSAPAAASRAVAKSGKLYDTSSWDLVSAVESGQELDDIPEEELPEELQAMAADERQGYVDEQLAKRNQIKQEIQALSRDRKDYIQAELEKQRAEAGTGLDEAIQEGLRTVAAKKGITFDEG